MAEAPIVDDILKLGKGPLRLWRLSNGGMKIGNRFVRLGLVPGASDILGGFSRIIKPEDIGKTIMQNVMLEVKDDAGKPTPKQQNFVDQARMRGALAGIVRSANEARLVMNYWDEDDQLCSCGDDRPAPGYKYCPDCTSKMLAGAA